MHSHISVAAFISFICDDTGVDHRERGGRKEVSNRISYRMFVVTSEDEPVKCGVSWPDNVAWPATQTDVV